MDVITIPQIDGTRYLAVDEDDAALYEEDPACVDSLTSHACLDVDESGRRTWARPFGCEDTPEGRAAIRDALES